MLIEVHSVTDNETLWLNPRKIMMATFQEGSTTLMLEGGIAMQIIESKADLRKLLDQVVVDETAIIIAQAYD